jgi:large subunit ribosomal protein L3
VGMTRVYDDAGIITPVTVILAEPNAVLQVKTVENDGYAAVQVGVFDQKEHRVTKPELGHFKKAGCTPKRFVREFTTNGGETKVGDSITVTTFKAGQIVDVIGISKGKGFQGPMKKHNFHGQGAAHGSKTHRRNGAIGMRSTPGRIYKNHGMAGHMGDEKVTVQNLRVVQVRETDNVLLISGAVPGASGSYVVVRLAIKGQPKPKGAANAGKAANPMKASKAAK